MKHIIWDFNGTLLNDAQLSVDLDNDVFDQIGVPSTPIKTAMLVGGGKIAFFLARILLDSGISVKIIEKRLERWRITETT